MVVSTVRVFVEQQQYFFETLWSKAIPAEQRIREIEEGIKLEVIETIREPEVTQARALEIIKSANEEILVIFSTSNAFRRQERAGAVDLLIRTAKSRHLKVRVLSPFDDYVRNIIDKIKKEDKISIEIRNIEEPLQTKVSVLIVDRTSLLSAELKSDSKDTSLEAIGWLLIQIVNQQSYHMLPFLKVFGTKYISMNTQGSFMISSNHTTR
jgi:two-component system sensor histidine kinase VicK